MLFTKQVSHESWEGGGGCPTAQLGHVPWRHAHSASAFSFRYHDNILPHNYEYPQFSNHEKIAKITNTLYKWLYNYTLNVVEVK